MANPHEKLAESLEALRALQKGGIVAVRSGDLSRTHRERLVKNGFLLEEMPRIDYLIHVSGELEEGFIGSLVRKLNGLEGIALAFQLDPGSLKSRKRLLF